MTFAFLVFSIHASVVYSFQDNFFLRNYPGVGRNAQESGFGFRVPSQVQVREVGLWGRGAMDEKLLTDGNEAITCAIH